MSSLMVLAIVLGNNVLRAEMTTEEIIARLEARASTVDSFQADLAMTMEMMGEKTVSRGTMRQIVISDGKVTWTYQPKMNMVTKIDLEKIAAEIGEETGEQIRGNISNPFQGLQRESISYMGTKEVEEKKVYVFQGELEKSAMQPTPFAPAKIEIWIGANDGLVRKMIMFNQEGKEMFSQSYTNVEVNIKVADGQFEFTPPEGAQVIDMTESTIKMIKQMKEAGK